MAEQEQAEIHQFAERRIETYGELVKSLMEGKVIRLPYSWNGKPLFLGTKSELIGPRLSVEPDRPTQLIRSFIIYAANDSDDPRSAQLIAHIDLSIGKLQPDDEESVIQCASILTDYRVSQLISDESNESFLAALSGSRQAIEFASTLEQQQEIHRILLLLALDSVLLRSITVSGLHASSALPAGTEKELEQIGAKRESSPNIFQLPAGIREQFGNKLTVLFSASDLRIASEPRLDAHRESSGPNAEQLRKIDHLFSNLLKNEQNLLLTQPELYIPNHPRVLYSGPDDEITNFIGQDKPYRWSADRNLYFSFSSVDGATDIRFFTSIAKLRNGFFTLSSLIVDQIPIPVSISKDEKGIHFEEDESNTAVLMQAVAAIEVALMGSDGIKDPERDSRREAMVQMSESYMLSTLKESPEELEGPFEQLLGTTSRLITVAEAREFIATLEKLRSERKKGNPPPLLQTALGYSEIWEIGSIPGSEDPIANPEGLCVRFVTDSLHHPVTTEVILLRVETEQADPTYTLFERTVDGDNRYLVFTGNASYFAKKYEQAEAQGKFI